MKRKTKIWKRDLWPNYRRLRCKENSKCVIVKTLIKQCEEYTRKKDNYKMKILTAVVKRHRGYLLTHVTMRQTTHTRRLYLNIILLFFYCYFIW